MAPITNHLYGLQTAQIGTFGAENTNVSQQSAINSGERQTFANGTTHQSEVSNINTSQQLSILPSPAPVY